MYWFIIAGAISSLSVLNAYVTCMSRELYCNAQAGLLPLGGWVAKLKSFKKNADPVDDADSYVPLRAILIVSVLPILLQFASFELLLTLGSFMIATAMFFQLMFFVYARHGAHGYYACNQISPTQFHLSGGLPMSLLIITFPIICVVILWIAQGWKPIVIFSIAQLFTFSIYGIQVLVERKQNVSRDKGYEALVESSSESIE